MMKFIFILFPEIILCDFVEQQKKKKKKKKKMFKKRKKEEKKENFYYGFNLDFSKLSFQTV